MMKRSSLAILCCFLLSACVFFDPVFDASSWEAYQRSFAAIKAKLSNDDLRRLDIALKYLLVEATPKIELDGQALTNAVVKVNLTNPNTILSRLGPRINGKSAAAIIQGLTIKLDAEISEAEARLQNSENVIGAVEISSPNYYWRRIGSIDQPVIEFSVRNAGKVPISRIYFRSVLTTPNRSIPWVKQEFVQNFKGGLEPRERQKLTLQPRYGDWNDKQLRDLPNPELKVAVINFEDANGQRMITVDNDILDVKRKVRALLQ
jgi:hypothetical protein